MTKQPKAIVPDEKTIAVLQRRYAEAVLERGDLPPDILKKFHLFQRLAAKSKTGHLNTKTAIRAGELAKELLPYFHFKIDDINWTKQ